MVNIYLMFFLLLHLYYIIIIMHVYIAPEPGNPVLRRCTISLSTTKTCFHPTHISIPKGAYNAYNVTQTQPSRPVSYSFFYGWVNQSLHDNIAAQGNSSPRPFSYEPYALNNWFIFCFVHARIHIHTHTHTHTHILMQLYIL